MYLATRLGAVLTTTLWFGFAAHAQPSGADVQPWRPMAYDAAGPEAVVGSAGGPRCTIFRPRVLGQSPHPVVLWGNGTGTQPVNYKEILQTLASWGFVVAAANTPNAGTGADMLGCLDWLSAENGREGSLYKGRLDLTKVGASGHSQGGGGTLMVGRDARIKTVAPLQPAVAGPRFAPDALTQQQGPILLLSGGADVVARPESQQQPVFESANQPVIWATLAGAGHMIPLHGGGTYSGIITAWFRWRLMGDAKAGALFEGERCGYCISPDWTVRKKGVL